MQELFEYLNQYILLEGKTIGDLNIDHELFKRFIDEWVLSEDGYNPSRKSEEAMNVYNDMIDVLRPKTRKYKECMKALYNFCTDFIDKLNEVGVYNITDEIIQLLIMRIEQMPANKMENMLGVGEEGIVVELHDKVVKCFFGDKIKKDKLDFYKACKTGKYKVFPKVMRIGKGYVVMEKLKMYTSKCDEYQYVIDKVYWDVYDGKYNLEDYTEEEQEVIKWLEEVKKAISETTIYADMGDLSEKNFGEREDGTIVYFDI